MNTAMTRWHMHTRICTTRITSTSTTSTGTAANHIRTSMITRRCCIVIGTIRICITAIVTDHRSTPLPRGSDDEDHAENGEQRRCHVMDGSERQTLGKSVAENNHRYVGDQHSA